MLQSHVPARRVPRSVPVAFEDTETRLNFRLHPLRVISPAPPAIIPFTGCLAARAREIEASSRLRQESDCFLPRRFAIEIVKRTRGQREEGQRTVRESRSVLFGDHSVVPAGRDIPASELAILEYARSVSRIFDTSQSFLTARCIAPAFASAMRSDVVCVNGRACTRTRGGRV